MLSEITSLIYFSRTYTNIFNTDFTLLCSNVIPQIFLWQTPPGPHENSPGQCGVWDDTNTIGTRPTVLYCLTLGKIPDRTKERPTSSSCLKSINTAVYSAERRHNTPIHHHAQQLSALISMMFCFSDPTSQPTGFLCSALVFESLPQLTNHTFISTFL